MFQLVVIFHSKQTIEIGFRKMDPCQAKHWKASSFLENVFPRKHFPEKRFSARNKRSVNVMKITSALYLTFKIKLWFVTCILNQLSHLTNFYIWFYNCWKQCITSSNKKYIVMNLSQPYLYFSFFRFSEPT